MQNNIDPAGNFQLPSDVDLPAAAALLETFKQSGLAGARLRVDASAVETMTLPSVQIILAAARDYGRITACNPSAGFLAAFDEFGVDCASVLECIEQAVPAEFS